MEKFTVRRKLIRDELGVDENMTEDVGAYEDGVFSRAGRWCGNICLYWRASIIWTLDGLVPCSGWVLRTYHRQP